MAPIKWSAYVLPIYLFISNMVYSKGLKVLEDIKKLNPKGNFGFIELDLSTDEAIKKSAKEV